MTAPPWLDPLPRANPDYWNPSADELFEREHPDAPDYPWMEK